MAGHQRAEHGRSGPGSVHATAALRDRRAVLAARYGNDRWIQVFAVGLAAALAWRWWRQSSAGLLSGCRLVVLAAIDLHEVATAPKWLAGMLRVSPFSYSRCCRRSRPAAARLAARGDPLQAVIYMAIAYAGVDTTGGRARSAAALPVVPAARRQRPLRDPRVPTQTGRSIDGSDGSCGAGSVSVAIHVSGTSRRTSALTGRRVSGPDDRLITPSASSWPTTCSRRS